MCLTTPAMNENVLGPLPSNSYPHSANDSPFLYIQQLSTFKILSLVHLPCVTACLTTTHTHTIPFLLYKDRLTTCSETTGTRTKFYNLATFLLQWRQARSWRVLQSVWPCELYYACHRCKFSTAKHWSWYGFVCTHTTAHQPVADPGVVCWVCTQTPLNYTYMLQWHKFLLQYYTKCCTHSLDDP